MALPHDDFSDVLVFSTRVAGPVVASAAFNGILELMKLGFEETQTPYTSSSQSARAWTEQWVHNQVYCPNCGSDLPLNFHPAAVRASANVTPLGAVSVPA
jgi:hypothetical protein